MDSDHVRIRENLLKEFETLKLPSQSDLTVSASVVVFCAEETDVIGENKERIDAGINLVKADPKKQLIFLGTKLHNTSFKTYLKSTAPTVTTHLPTNRTQDSSRTQLKYLSYFLSKHKSEKIVIVSHAYHLPRLMRYVEQFLPNTKVLYFPVGQIVEQLDRVKTEIDKIVKYGEQGDLPLFLDSKKRGRALGSPLSLP